MTNANKEIKEQTKEQILEAAITWKLDHPFQEPQITQIAAIVGISGRTLSRYFPNKEDMLGLAAIRYMTLVNDDHAKALASAGKDGRTAVEQLRSFFCARRAAYHKNPAAIKVYAVGNMRCVDYALRHQLVVDSASQSVKKAMFALLEEGKRDGSVRENLDLALAVDLMYTGFNGMMHQIAMTFTSTLSEPEKNKSALLYKEFLKMVEWYVTPE